MQGQVVQFTGPGSFILGRARDADFRFPEDDLFISRRHVCIEIAPPKCRLRDLGTTGYRSTNLPQLNGFPVDREAELRDGDLLELGLSVFRITFQAPALPPEPHPVDPGPDPRATLRSRRLWAPGTTVLAVEDEPLTARLIRACLEQEGLQVLEAANGQEGLALLRRHRVDLITTDLMMPNMDGFWLIREIRDLRPDPLGLIPILVLTANGREEDALQCLAMGADGYLTKPFAQKTFLAELWRFYLNIKR